MWFVYRIMRPCTSVDPNLPHHLTNPVQKQVPHLQSLSIYLSSQLNGGEGFH